MFAGDLDVPDRLDIDGVRALGAEPQEEKREHEWIERPARQINTTVAP